MDRGISERTITPNAIKEMKTILFMLAIMINTIATAQDNQLKDSLYVVSYTTGPGWDQTKSPAEQTHFAAHSKHLSTLRKDGVIKLGARAGEKGIIVFSAKTYEAAKEIINNDIAVKEGLFDTDIQKFNVFYSGCVER